MSAASFAKYGVDADTIFVRGAPTLVAAMAANEIDVGYTGGTAVVGAVAYGADLKVLSAFTNRVTYDLMVKPGIKTPEDLRGKKFGIQAIGGTVWMGAILALEHLKLDPERDKINILAVGDQNVLAQALESGTIDATVLDGVQSRRLARSGISNPRGFEQMQSADSEFRLCHARAQHSEEPATGGKFAESGHRGRGVFALAAAKTDHAKNPAKISEGQRKRRGRRLPGSGVGNRQEALCQPRRRNQRGALDEAKQSESRKSHSRNS